MVSEQHITEIRQDMARMSDQLRLLRAETQDLLRRSGGAMSGQLHLDAHLQMTEINAPSQPESGLVRIYPKSDGHLYCQDDTGTEYDLTTGAGGGGAPDNAEYLVLTLNATLTQERRFVAGTGLSETDGGAGGDYTLDVALAHSDLTGVTADLHHAGFVGLEDNAATPVTPNANDRIRFTDDGIVNADAGVSVIALSIAQGQIDHGSIGGLGDDDHTQYPRHATTETISAAWTFTADPQLACNLDFTGGDRYITGSNHIVLNPTGDLYLDPIGNDVLPITHRDITFGSSTYWYAGAYIDKIYAGIIKTIVFEKDIIHVFNGSLMVAKASASLRAVATFPAVSGSYTFYVNESGRFATNDIVRLKDFGQDTWGTVTGVSGDGVTVDVESGGSTTFPIGHPVVNYGPSGQGLILLTSNDIGIQNAPSLSMFSHAGSPWSTITEYIRLGNLDDWGGFSTETWGLGIGRYAANYPNFYVDATNGNLKMRLYTTDYMVFAYNGGSPYARITGDLEINGGSVTFGGGVGTLDDNGITIDITTAYAGPRAYRFYYSGAVRSMMDAYASAGLNVLRINVEEYAGKDTTLHLYTNTQNGYTGKIRLETRMGGVARGYIDFWPHTNSANDYQYMEISANEIWMTRQSKLFISGTSMGSPSADQTVGLTVDQYNLDDVAIQIKGSYDIAHGVTSVLETDTFFAIMKTIANYGGARLYSLNDSGSWNMALHAITVGEDTTKSTAGAGNVAVVSALKSGTGQTNHGADANMVIIRDYDATRFIFDAEGEMHSDATIGAGDDWDDWDDLVLASDLSRLPPGKFDEVLRYQAEDLERAGLLTLSVDEGGQRHAFLKNTALHMFAMCCFREVGQRMQAMQAKMDIMERALLSVGIDPGRLS